MSAPRTLLVWCPDWSVVAAEIIDGVPAAGPVAVLHANRVTEASPAARAEAVVPGLRRREAQSRCPQLVLVDYDPVRDARAFEPVVAAVEQVVAGVAVLRPGSCALAARGPARYFGSEERAAEHIVEQIAQECAVEAQAGIADGSFAAELAARAGRIVPRGRSAEFLAGASVDALSRPELASRLHRLGVHTLGAFAALPAGDVLTRFGFDAAVAHRLAAGVDHQPLAVRRPPPELTVTEEFDEPLDRVDRAAFAARALAEHLHERLAGHGLACTRLGIEAVTAHGEQLHRSWRHDGLLTAAAIADRVRWQLASWLQPRPPAGTGARAAGGAALSPAPSAGVRLLRLLPEGVLHHTGLQPGLWGEAGEERQRAGRALARVQGLLGPTAVVTAVLQGGRSPAEAVRLVPWGDDRGEPGDEPGGRAGAAPPWPGRLPPPAPATVLPVPVPVLVHDAGGRPVTVTARLAVSAPPASLTVGPAAVEITAWSGPWPVEERWWAPAEAYRAVRFQVCLADGRALLLALSAGQWSVVAEYD